METHRLILPGDLNQFGYLFGGRLLSWIDEASWIAASLDFPDCQFVTIGMDEVVFRKSVRKGTILTIRSTQTNIGETSATYKVEAFIGRRPSASPMFSTRVTFVNLDNSGKKIPIPKS